MGSLHVAAVAFSAAFLAAGSAAAAPAFTTLQPGGFRTLAKEIPVNIVFIGYEAGTGSHDINLMKLMGQLPASYKPINRYKAFYGLPASTGLEYTYKYKVVWADDAFENSFFTYLKSLAVTKPLTAYQGLYNQDPHKSTTVNNNVWIDAPSVEKWLALHGTDIAVNTADYTIFFVNWWGRSDFKFHVYTKTNEPDPDTGYNFGLARSSRKVIAWGGTAANDVQDGTGSISRVWFYDLSAGPEYFTANYDLSHADVDGDGVLDYRMPPVWEYGNSTGYRPFNDLSGDLGKVARYVAIDLLFTTSPLYKPAISPPKLPSVLQVDVNTFDQQQSMNSPALIKPAMVTGRLNALQPLNTFSTKVTGFGFDNKTWDVFNCFMSNTSCYGQRLFGIAFADLFLYFDDHLNQYLTGYGDYEIPVFTFNSNIPGGLLGFADDNWRDGTQSYVFGFLDPSSRPFYGYTTTLIHEVGHHLGMSHPHDGYDSEANIDFGPAGAFYYSWSGDESNSMMSYIDLNWDFSQFDQDNMNRFLAAIYINEGNSVLAKILASPRASTVQSQLAAADTQAGIAVAKFSSMDWAAAAANARVAYLALLGSAAQINVQIEPQAYQADYRAKGRSGNFVDPLDSHRSAP